MHIWSGLVGFGRAGNACIMYLSLGFRVRLLSIKWPTTNPLPVISTITNDPKSWSNIVCLRLRVYWELSFESPTPPAWHGTLNSKSLIGIIRLSFRVQGPRVNYWVMIVEWPTPLPDISTETPDPKSWNLICLSLRVRGPGVNYWLLSIERPTPLPYIFTETPDPKSLNVIFLSLRV